MIFDDELNKRSYEEIIVNNKNYFVFLDDINDKNYKSYLCYKLLDDIKTSEHFEAESVPNYTKTGKEIFLANYFDWFLVRYIRYQINEIYYKYLHTTIDELGQDIYIKYPEIINAFPNELEQEKKFLLNLNTIREHLNSTCERGGGFEIIGWLLDEVKSGLFQLLLVWAVTNGIKNVIKKLKGFKTGLHVKSILKNHKKDINDILKFENKYFKTEDEISSFIEEKTNIYKEQIIEIIKSHNKKEIK